jgi:hypothetical protein
MNKLKLIIVITIILSLLGCESKQETTFEREDQSQEMIPPPPPKFEIKKQENIDPEIEKEVLAVVNENLEATRVEDKERVLATIHKESPQYNSTVQGLEFVFMNYDLEFFMEKAEVIEVSEDGAKVYYILITRSVKGQGFLNKRDEGIHHLKKQDGNWKIFQTENISTKPIQ